MRDVEAAKGSVWLQASMACKAEQQAYKHGERLRTYPRLIFLLFHLCNRGNV